MRTNMTMTIFRAGNSDVVAIPKELREKYGWKTGVKVDIQPLSDGVNIKIVKTSKQPISTEFDRWLKHTAKKYGPALRELAKK